MQPDQRLTHWVTAQIGDVVMERHTEFPLFFQSAFAMVAFLIVASLIAWAFEAKPLSPTSAAPSVQISVVK